jgi:hypothetical protein
MNEIASYRMFTKPETLHDLSDLSMPSVETIDQIDAV